MLIENEQVMKYKEWLEASNYSNNTKLNYFYYVKRLVGSELTNETINSICNNAHNVFRSFLKSFIVCFNLDIKVPTMRGRKPQKEVKYFTDQEMELILDNVKEARLNLMIYLMYRLGLRVSEAINLKKNDFDFVNNYVKGVGKGNKEFKMRIPKNRLNILKGYLDLFENDDYVFRWDVKHQRQKAWYEIKKEVMKILPYKKNDEVFCHAFRHTCGTHLMNKGLNLRQIQEFLRHKHLETVSHYTAIDKTQLENDVEDKFN